MPIDEIISNSIDLIFEYNTNPHLSGVNIKFHHETYKSKNYKQTRCILQEAFLGSIDPKGCIQVFYHNGEKSNDLPYSKQDAEFLAGFSKRLGNLLSVKLANEALNSSLTEYQKVIERFNDATYLLYDRRFEFVNSQFTKLFGYSKYEITNKKFKFNKLIAPESIPLIEHRQKLLNVGKAISTIYEFAAYTKDGKKIICETSVSYLKYKTGTAVQGIIRDVTERRIAEYKLRETKEKLAAALEIQKSNQKRLLEIENLKSVQELAAGVAHEFAQPLQALTNYLNLLKFEREDSPYINKCMDMVARISDLTTNLRHITSLERKEYIDSEIMDLKASSTNRKKVEDRKILILDDEEEIQNTMVEMFEAYGYKCDGALNGVEGLDLVSKNKYWLIVSDVMMPKMSGPEFFRRVQKNPNYNHFIFLTGYEIPDSEKDTVSKADAVLSKPISFKNFFKTIDTISVNKTN
ncbi:MAG: PAS domain S-box protein [Calditrichaceae bacterium]